MVRNVLDSDVEMICDIYNYYIKNSNYTFEEDTLSYSEMKERIDEIKKDFPYIVYVENDEVLGYAYLNYYNKRSAYFPSCDLSIYVKNGCSGKSIGRVLYAHIEKEALKSGFKKILSCITLSNERSIKFHLNNGFKECGVIKNVGYKHDEWLSIMWMDKDL